MLIRSGRHLNSDFSGEVDVKIRKRCPNFVCSTSAKRRIYSVTTTVVPVSPVVCEPHSHIRGDGISSLMVFGVAP